MTEALPSPAHGLSARLHYLPLAVGASVLHALIMIPGYNEDGSFQTSDWLVMLAISLVVSIAVFSFVVPRGGATTAIVLGVLCVLLGVVAFWAMLSLPLAAAAAVVALRARAVAEERTRATVGLALAALGAVATVVITIGDMIAN